MPDKTLSFWLAPKTKGGKATAVPLDSLSLRERVRVRGFEELML